MEVKSIVLKGEKVEYLLTRKKVKCLNMMIKPDCKVYVSANFLVAQEDIDKFMVKNADIILNGLKKFRLLKAEEFNYNHGDRLFLYGDKKTLVINSGKNRVQSDENYVYLTLTDTQNLELKKKGIDSLYKHKTKQMLEMFFDKCYMDVKALYGINYPKITLKKLKASWGNCRKKTGEIAFSIYLSKMDVECIKYVFYHELCHLIEANHSPKFYFVVSRFVPNYKYVIKKMKTYGR